MPDNSAPAAAPVTLREIYDSVTRKAKQGIASAAELQFRDGCLALIGAKQAAPSDSPGDGGVLAPPAASAPEPGRNRRLDWGLAAQLIAAGRSLDEVAAELGSTRERIARNLRRSRRFNTRIERERSTAREQARARMQGITAQVAEGLMQEAKKGDTRALLRLAELYFRR